MKSQSPWQWMNHRQLDKARWDQTIAASRGPGLYGLSGYLTLLCDDWDALVHGDYAAVMPLPVRRKMGIRYVYQPWGLAQGGIYSKESMKLDFEQALLTEAMGHYGYGTIDLNSDNRLQTCDGAKVRMRTNYVLPLHQAYASLHNAYAPDTQKNLRRAARFAQSIRPCHDVSKIAHLYEQAYGHLNPGAKGDGMQKMVQATQWLLQQGHAFAYMVIGHETEQVLGGALFGKYANRIYYLLGAPTSEGREKKSIYFLLDQVIQEYAGQDMLFDFEGSDIPSVASFYKKFGSQNQPYSSVHFNRLPWPLRLLKP